MYIDVVWTVDMSVRILLLFIAGYLLCTKGANVGALTYLNHRDGTTITGQ